LSRILVPALSDKDAQRIVAVCDLVKSEVNVKEVEILRGDVKSPQGDSEINIVKRVKPDFKALGPRFGKRMKTVAATVSGLGAVAIATLEREGRLQIEMPDDQGAAEILLTDVEVLTDDIPGWLVSSEGGVTVALDITISDELKAEGLAREVVNRVQGLRKNTGLEVTDRIELILDSGVELRGLLAGNLEYIRAETLAGSLHWAALGEAEEIDLDGEHAVRIALNKLD
jgi:isoleucyl-tRNA synthetase